MIYNDFQLIYSCLQNFTIFFNYFTIFYNILQIFTVYYNIITYNYNIMVACGCLWCMNVHDCLIIKGFHANYLVYKIKKLLKIFVLPDQSIKLFSHVMYLPSSD